MVAVGLALVVAGLSAAPSDDVPPERVTCDECHDDFVPCQVTVDAPTEVPTGVPFEVSVTVLDEGMHAVYGASALLTVTDPETMVVETGEAAVVDIQEQGSVGFRDSATFQVPINPGAQTATFSMSGSGGFLDDLDLYVSGPEGGSWSATGSGLDESLSLDASAIEGGGYGDYQVTVDHPQGVRTATFTLDIEVEYGSGAMMLRCPDDLQQDDSHTFEFTLRGVAEGAVGVMVTVSGTAVHLHESGSVEEEDFVLERQVPIEVGDEFAYGPGDDGDDGGAGGGLLGGGRVLGLASALLLAVSISSSGNLGRLRLPRRARLHCWSSYLLVGTLLLHWGLLYAGPYGPPAALGTGSLLLLCIAGLSVTGARPALLEGKVLGLPSRRLHLYLTFAVVLVLVVHVVLNGSHLAFLRT
jgi:hypothetical protein